jgi:pimeloyl-ACP methyl ester carboxylesterase
MKRIMSDGSLHRALAHLAPRIKRCGEEERATREAQLAKIYWIQSDKPPLLRRGSMLDRLLKFIGVPPDPEGPLHGLGHKGERLAAWSSFPTAVKSALKRTAPAIVSKGKWPLFAYAGLVATLAFTQKRFVFNPSNADCPVVPAADTHEITKRSLPVRDGSRLKGWLLRPNKPDVLNPAIIYYGGRSEEVSWLKGAASWFPSHVILALNYRGYGESDGDPTEKTLFTDGLDQFDWLTKQAGVDPNAVTLMGRSLGTGVASYVAAHRPAEKVVLITPYDSILAVARRRFWFTPLSLILRHKFDSIAYAKRAGQPCLALVAEHDDVVPAEHTHKLLQAWQGDTKLVSIPRSDHYDIPYLPATLAVVAEWLGYAGALTSLPGTSPASQNQGTTSLLASSHPNPDANEPTQQLRTVIQR